MGLSNKISSSRRLLSTSILEKPRNPIAPIHATKASLQKSGKPTKKIRFHSASCVSATASQESAIFHKLDPSVPEQAHKMKQRRKAIAKGKNTVGYDEYCRQIPRQQRKKRSMDTPSTPDHTLDIPNRKWNGMVKAWRIALHKYDPVDLQKSFDEAQGRNHNNDQSPLKIKQPLTVKEQELQQAKSSGLLDLVELGNFDGEPSTVSPLPAFSHSDTSMDAEIPNATVGVACSTNVMSELDQWEGARCEKLDDVSDIDSVVGESDDDLL